MIRTATELFSLFVLSLTLVTVTPGNAAAQLVSADVMEECIGLVVQGKYQEAELLAGSRLKNDPVSYNFLIASILHARMGELESNDDQKRFAASADFIITYTDSALKDDPGNINALFGRGLIRSYHAVLHNRNKNYLRAVRTAKNGAGDLKKYLEAGGTDNTAVISIAAYLYWSSAKNFLRILPGVKDRRQEALVRIKENLIAGNPGYALGLNQYFWILVDAKRYEEAETIAKTGLALYPESRFFMYPLASLYQRMEDWSQAAELYGKVANSLKKSGLGGQYMWAKATLKQAKCLNEKGAVEESKILARRIVDNQAELNDRKRCEKIIREAEELMR